MAANAAGTTSEHVNPSRRNLSQLLSTFINMMNARKDYIGRGSKDLFGFESRLSSFGLIAIFTPLVVMALHKRIRRMLVELHCNVGVAGSNPASCHSASPNSTSSSVW